MSSRDQPFSNQTQFGRAWKVTITTFPVQGVSKVIAAFSDAWQPEPLRMTFDCYQSTSGDGFWYADIALYNLNGPTEQEVLTQGMMVKLQAGYQNQPELGTIYEGTLFQPMWERENGVDFKLTLRCMVGLIEQRNNFVNMAVEGGLTQGQIISRMAGAARYPLDVTNVTLPSSTRTSRGKILFGQPRKYLVQAAKSNDAVTWFTNRAANVVKLRGLTEGVPTLVYGPGTGLIGTPQQTQDGVNIKVLLDARAEMGMQFQLTPSDSIKQFAISVHTYPTILDTQGLYTIAAIRHYGDSRGEDWYTELTGFTYVGSILALTSEGAYSE